MSSGSGVKLNGALDVAGHSAVLAWQRLRPTHKVPEVVETLKEARGSFVYRLRGVERGGRGVIAKRRRRESVAVERAVYDKIMPRLPVWHLQFYGCVATATRWPSRCALRWGMRASE